jgi:hypothetical protein
MSLLLKAFPHGRPDLRARTACRRRTTLLAVLVSLLLVVLPLAGTATARSSHPARHHAAHAKHHAKPQTKHAKHIKHAKHHTKHHAKAVHPGTRKKPPKVRPPRVPGQPARNYVVPSGSFFSFPNKGRKAQTTISRRVLATVQSTWGGHLDRYHAPLPTNGRIRLVSWSFDDWALAHALVAAKRRGVSVQVIAAKKANRGRPSWNWLRRKLGSQLYRPHYPGTNYTWSFARQCRGSCRGLFGTAHAKYYLFDNVGSQHVRDVTVQTSMNLTTFAQTGQWNQAQVSHSARVYQDFYSIFRQARLARPLPNPYHVKDFGSVVDFFFPRYGVTPALDPVYQTLNGVTCYGATAGGTGQTRINVIQYAIYGPRGEWIAQKLRYLWEHKCSVSIIYSVASRPVLAILRSHSGRGPIPMRQSVITDGYGTIVKYNHSKWMTIVGHWGTKPDAYVTFSGSANWANLAAGSDEQMQRIYGRTEVVKYLANFAQTWAQRSSHMPGYGVLPAITGRVIPYFARDVPAGEPAWGKGIFKYMTPD